LDRDGVIAGVTTAIDSAHAVMATMGARWLFVRTGEEEEGDDIASRALEHVGHEDQMRAELREVVRGLLQFGKLGEPYEVTETVRQALIALANLTTVARSPVEREGSRRQITLVGDREAPTRVVKALSQIWRACGVVGVDQASAWELLRRLSGDSIPKVRRLTLRYLMGARINANPGQVPADQINFPDLQSWRKTTEVAEAINHPTNTTREALEDLMVHGLLDRRIIGKDGSGTSEETNTNRPYYWRLSDRGLRWAQKWQQVARQFEVENTT
jgi:hypothetical protein